LFQRHDILAFEMIGSLAERGHSVADALHEMLTRSWG